MSESCQHRNVFTFDSMPPTHTCEDCREILPLTEQDKRDYRDYTGHDYVDPMKQTIGEMKR